MITPRMTGVYSIAEVIDDSNKRPLKTIFCFQNDINNKERLEFSKDQLKSLNKVGEMVTKNGGKFIKSITELIEYLNKGK